IKTLCIVQNIKNHVTKKGDRMAFLELSDGTGTTDAIIFPELFSRISGLLRQDAILLVTAKISAKDDGFSLICGEISGENDFSGIMENMKLCIKIKSSELENTKSAIRSLCENFSGKTQVVFYLTDLRKMISPKNKLSLEISSRSFEELRKILPESFFGLIK
ncbi:MAG: OB-fold nucleic acid binding domain-containing protein, partial [Muribaculaceae bacterium]|nr:OB-fold nucleic acid binding domain-containing protein [Muribaculaceae bacterium]